MGIKRAVLLVGAMALAIVVLGGVGLAAAFSPAASAEKNATPVETTDTTASDTTTPVTTESHSWNGYHWARTSNTFNLKAGDNVSDAWDSTLDTTISDWSTPPPDSGWGPDVVDMTKVTGGTNPRPCKATLGQDEVCNAKYGKTDWLGMATVWLYSGGHIAQGTVKLNDTYFNTQPYNTDRWRNLVSCQEVGHTLGLDHQDENFDNPNLGTCMDYTRDPSTNQHPNKHDYEELGIIYSHLDTTNTILSSTKKGKGPLGDPNDPGNEPGDGPPAWGKEVFRSADGRESVFEQDHGDGQKKVTHVRWTEERAAKHGGGNKE